MNNKQPRKAARQGSSRFDKQNDSRRGNTRNASGRRPEHHGDNRHTAARRPSEHRLGTDYIEGRRACAEALKAGVPLKLSLIHI